MEQPKPGETSLYVQIGIHGGFSILDREDCLAACSAIAAAMAEKYPEFAERIRDLVTAERQTPAVKETETNG